VRSRRVHPGSHGNGSASLTSTCIAGFTVTYTGKSAHAGGAPETAINALDAAVAAYVNVSVLRQQIPGTSRVHGIIAGSEGWSTNGEPRGTTDTCVFLSFEFQRRLPRPPQSSQEKPR
jgi:metal-dependent amidase/aminoacylase/carboxypeptidase family protein